MAAERTASEPSSLAVYLRVSSDEQKQQGTIETQRAAAGRYVALHDCGPVGWYADDGVSGTVPFHQRPEGARLLAEARAGRVTTLVCWRLDRMGRNALAVLQAVETLEQAGVRLVSITESFDTSTPAGRLQLNMLATIAQFERDSIVQRVDEGMRRRLQDTTWMGGRAPIGYRVEGKRREARLVLADDADTISGYSEVDVVRLSWHLLVEVGWPCDRIAARLSDLGIPTREGGHGARWNPTVINRILGDPIYAGTRTHQAQDGTIHTSAVPAILTAEQVQQAQQALRDHRRYSHKSPNHDYLLKGLLRCGLCGQSYTTMVCSSRLGGSREAARAAGRSKVWRYYVCSTQHYRTHQQRKTGAPIPPTCPSASVRAVQLEADIWADVEQFIRNPGRVLALLAAKQQGSAEQEDATRARLANVQSQLDGTQQQRDSVLALYRRGRISERDLDRQLDEIAREETTTRAEQTRLLAQLADATAGTNCLEIARTLLQRLHARLDSEPMTPALQREVLETLVAFIIVDTEEVGTSTRGKVKRRAVVRVRYVFDDPAQAAPALAQIRGVSLSVNGYR